MPTGGLIAWDAPATAVTQGTAYAWTYVPVDVANYNNLVGTAVPYARRSGSTGGGGGGATSYTVKFETNGGSTVANQSIASGGKAVATANPTK